MRITPIADRPDPAHRDEGGQRRARVGEGEHAERDLEQPGDQQQPPVGQEPAGGEGSGDRERADDDQPRAKEDRERDIPDRARR